MGLVLRLSTFVNSLLIACCVHIQISTMQATRGKTKDIEQQNLSVPAKKRSGTLADVAEVRVGYYSSANAPNVVHNC